MINIINLTYEGNIDIVTDYLDSNQQVLQYILENKWNNYHILNQSISGYFISYSVSGETFSYSSITRYSGCSLSGNDDSRSDICFVGFYTD